MTLYITTGIALLAAFSLFGLALMFTIASKQKRIEEKNQH